MKYFKLFIILFKKQMFEYIKEPFYFLGKTLLHFIEFFGNLVLTVIFFIYAILLFVLFPLKMIRTLYNAFIYRKKWMTEKKLNQYFGGKDE